MADESEKPPELPPEREAIRAQAALAAYDKTQQIIDDEIEKQKNNIRNNKTEKGEDGGILGWIKSILFMIAEFFNMGDWVAETFGGQPTKEQKDLFARTVAETATKTAFSKDFGSAGETEKKVSAAVRKDLNALKENGRLPAFTAEYIELAAVEAGKAAAAEYSNIKLMHQQPKPSAAVVRGGDKTQRINSVMENVIANTPLSAMPDATKAQIRTIGAAFIANNEAAVTEAGRDPSKFKPLMDKLAAELVANPEMRRQMEANPVIKDMPGNTLAEKTSGALAMILENYREQFAAAVKGEAVAAAATPPVDMSAAAAQTARDAIVTVTDAGIKERAAKETLAYYNSNINTIQSWWAYTKEAKSAMDVLNTYYENDGKGNGAENYSLKHGIKPDDPALRHAQEIACAFAVDQSCLFNEAQRKKIGALIAEVIQETKLPDNKLDAGNALQGAIDKKLKEHSEDINKLSFGYNPAGKENGTTVENINKNNVNWYKRLITPTRWDVLGEIAKVSGNAVRNDPQALAQLKQAQDLMMAAAAVKPRDEKNARMERALKTAGTTADKPSTPELFNLGKSPLPSGAPAKAVGEGRAAGPMPA